MVELGSSGWGLCSLHPHAGRPFYTAYARDLLVREILALGSVPPLLELPGSYLVPKGLEGLLPIF